MAAHATHAAETRLVGLIIDDREVATIEVVYAGGDYYLPIRDITPLIGASVSAWPDGITFSTPGGDVEVRVDELFTHDDTLFIHQQTLEQRLSLQLSFDSSRYAIELSLPWWRGAAETSAAPLPTPDRVPARFGVTQLRADYGYTTINEIDSQYLDYRVAGSALDGRWRVDVRQDFDNETTPEEYYWLRNLDDAQVLIGRQDAFLHPLFPSTEFTGGQLLLSNRNLVQPAGYGLTRSDFARSLARPQQDIRGMGQSGAIAELRVNGRILARQRVRLDGSYEFLQAQLPTRGFTDVEVLLYDGRSGALLERQDFSRSSTELMLERGHSVALFGAGQSGNGLDPDDPHSGAAGLAQWRSGITSSTTLEATWQGVAGDSIGQAGIVQGLGQRWVAVLGMAADSGGRAGQAELFGYGNRWNLDYMGQERGSGYLDAESRRLHDARFRYQLNPDLMLGGRARYQDDSYDEDAFLLPGASWRPSDRFDLRAWPNVDGDYRIDSRYRPSPFSLLSYSFEADEHTATASYWSQRGVEYYLETRLFDNSDARYEAGIRWDLGVDSNSRMTIAGVATSNGDSGFLASAESNFLPGLYASLEVRDDPPAFDLDHDFDPGLRMQFRLTLDFSVTHGGLVATSSALSESNTGSVAGRFRVRNSDHIPERLNKVTLMVDGHPRTVPSSNGRFHVGGVSPGLHRIRLDQESLPIELMPVGDPLWVKVSHGAVTRVDFWTELQFGVAGRVSSSNGVHLANTRVKIRNADEMTVAIVRTDQFGLFRADSLTPGTYSAHVLSDDEGQSVASRQFTIADDFLFGVDLAVAEAGPESVDR